MSDLEPVINLLAANLGNLNNKDGDFFHYVPFLADIKTYGDEATEAVGNLHRDIAEGIALLLDNHGHLNHGPQETPQQIVRIMCAQCSGDILTFDANRPVSGKQIIEAISQRDPSCSTKHATLTPDVIRQRIQEQANDV